MRLVVWVSVVFPVLYSQGTDACPDECYCGESFYCNGTEVNCGVTGLIGVPINIPRDTCYLYLGNNKITTLQNGSFDELTNLRRLYLNSNRITTLKNGIFDQLANLHILSLDDNEIAILPNGLFDVLTNLQFLYFWENRITTLPNGIFDELTNLKTLNLRSNKIATLPNGIFDALTKLQTLELYGNPLICNCPLVDIIRLAKRRRLQLAGYPSCQNPVTLRNTWLNDLILQEIVCDSDSTTGITSAKTTVPDSTTGSTGVDTTVTDFIPVSTDAETVFSTITGFGKYSTCTKHFEHCIKH